MNSRKCPFCKDKIDKGMTYYDHWCDVGECEDAAVEYSSQLEEREDKK